MKSRIFFAGFSLFLSGVLVVPAGAELTFNIGSHTSGDFSASSIHRATNGPGPDTVGRSSRELGGSMVGDVDANGIFAISGGTISGRVGSLRHRDWLKSGSRQDTLQVEFTGGKLRFYSNGSLGGWIEYAMQVVDNSGNRIAGSRIDMGTLYFAPEDMGYNENPPGPNNWEGMGASTTFSLWGNNYAYKVGNSSQTAAYWSFLAEDLGYDMNNLVTWRDVRFRDQHGCLTGNLPFGADLHGDGPADFSAVPEPTSLLMWSALIGISIFMNRRLR